MAEPHRADKKRRPARALLLVGAIMAIVLSGLFMARTAQAAPVTTTAHTATAVQAAPAAPAAKAAPAETTAKVAQNTICNVPGFGDLLGLVQLCNSGTSGLIGDANNICASDAPTPVAASSGINSMIATPGKQSTTTLYDNYGIAGQYWASYQLQCSQMTSTIGNNVAGMVFDMAESLDRLTITVYQSASNPNLLAWLSNSVDTLISDLGNAIFFPYLAPVVIIAAIWLAWQGLVRKRATRTFEGTIWMVVACAFAIWLIGQPGNFTSVGTDVSNGVSSTLNAAFAHLPAAPDSNCLPITNGDPDSVTANYSFTTGSGLVDQNANELWSVLVCKPWLDGEFGTTQYAAPNSPAARTNLINEYGRDLLVAQAFANNEPVTTTSVQAKQDIYRGIAAQLEATNPAAYSLFQGDQWTTRLEIGFEALFAAVAAGLLILLISLTLIMLKLGFLLLLVAGPLFLIIGIHPGFGRVVAIRWFELLVGVLLRQVAIALTLSVLLYCYSLIMGQSDLVLPWVFKILMITLVTVTVFIYRKPFAHLFSAVGYGMLGADERAQLSMRESTFGFRRATGAVGGTLVPGIGGIGVSRWARRAGVGSTGDATGTDSSAATATGVRVTEGATGATVADSHVTTRQWSDAQGGGSGGRAAPPLPLTPNGGAPANGPTPGWARRAGDGTSAGRSAPPTRTTGPQQAAPPAASQPTAPFWSRPRREPKK
jgi:hypothetical protein